MPDMNHAPAPIKAEHDNETLGTFGDRAREILPGLEPTEMTGVSLTPDDVREFQRIVAEETGVQMNEHEAWGRAIELIALVRMLPGPIPEDPAS